METSSIVLLVGSAAISFGLGRIFVHFRDKRRREQVRLRQAQALLNRAPDVPAKNKAKRKRQLQNQRQAHKTP